MRRAVLILAIAAALGTPGQAAAFHHGFVPGSTCGAAQAQPNAGGNNPTARAAIITHNPAQGGSLPLPPAGTLSQAGNTPAEQNCTQAP